MISVQGWRYGPPGPSVYGAASGFDDASTAIDFAVEHFGISSGDFEEPMIPPSMDSMASEAYDQETNLVVVHDDQGFVLAHAPLPAQVEWPIRFREAHGARSG